MRGIPANILANIRVCIAIWLATARRTVIEKLAGIVLLVSAVIAAGFEYSIANLYFVPMGCYWPRSLRPWRPPG